MVSKTVHFISAFMNPEEVKPLIEEQLPEVTVKVVQAQGLKGVEGKDVIRYCFDLTPCDIEGLKDAEILILDNNLLHSVAHTLPNLKWLQCCISGVDKPLDKMADDIANGNYPRFVATRFSGNTSGQYMLAYCLCFMLGNERGFIEHIRLQPSKDWVKMRQATNSAQRLMPDLDHHCPWRRCYRNIFD
ncbi:hypothetical protein HDE_05798 [Halotydeus destructor]|nr:hypothetical protein HDE_05798 [Halotydeus destructor]